MLRVFSRANIEVASRPTVLRVFSRANIKVASRPTMLRVSLGGHKMMSLLCLYVLLVTAQGRKFHEQLDREDLLYYFGVQEQHQVPSYMFIDEPTMTSSKRKGGDAMVFSMTAFGESFVFQLKVNENILTPDCVLQHFQRNRVISSSPCADHYRPCNYHGQSLTRIDQWAAVSYCDLLVGLISTSSHDLTILPLKSSQLELIRSLNVTTPLTRTYIVNKLTRKTPGVPKNGTGTRQDTLTTVEIVTSGPVVNYHESDNSLYGLNLTSFLTINMNIVFSLFHDETLTYHLSPTITQITVVSHTQFLDNTTDNYHMLCKFADWDSKRSQQYRADLVILLTKQRLARKEETIEYDVNGLAYTSGMCHDKESSCILAKDIGLGTAFTIAHEIGHTLQMGHDNDFAKCNDSGNIMQRFATYGQSSFHWSSCSDEAMRIFFESNNSKCLKNKTRLPSNRTVLPGSLYDEEAQCKLTFGNNFWPNYNRKNKCGQLSCCFNQRQCINIGYPLADGTECGNGTRKWCIEGQCVDMGPNGPEPIPGGWSPWGAWSVCSRTAGGGVRFRKRECNNPKPRYNGKMCAGKESEVRLCNIKPYGMSDAMYKAQQRTQQQAVIGRYVCSMKRTMDNITTWPPYIDGTNCRNRDPNHISKCYQGLCKIFGCDGFLDSAFAFDACGVCNGNGTQCRGIARMLDVQALYNKGNTMSFKIPARSTGIVIRNSNTQIIRLKSDQLPLGDYYYDRYDIVLTRHNDSEDIHIIGPLEKDFEFQVEIMVQHVNPQHYDLRIYYKYYTPLVSSLQQQYQWTSKWSTCSVTCGTGFKSLIHTCTDIQLQTSVEDERCETKEYPADNITTCIQKACNTRWCRGNWSPCSTTCGVGISTRQVVCINSTEFKLDTCAPLPLEKCRHLSKPHDTMTCQHQQPCQPVWRITHTSMCSHACGIGKQIHIIKCVSGTNSSLEVDGAFCNPENKPAEFNMCCNKHCLIMNENNKNQCRDDVYCDHFNISHCTTGIVRKRCPHMCSVCGCFDKTDCSERGVNACTKFVTWAITNCSKTCGFCTSKGGYSVDLTNLLQCKYN